MKAYGCIAVVFLAGCTTTHVQWDAASMREGVIDYYNDEIMDNLIRGSQGLPFVHVDISTVTALVASKLNGTVGGGETRSNTTAASAAGVISSVTRTVMRPFTLSVTPERSDSLTITATPVLGKTEIYDAYTCFLKDKDATGRAKNLGESVGPPREPYVPGTKKRRGTEYYYIPLTSMTAYQALCKTLFETTPRSRSFEKDINEARDAAEQARAQAILNQ